MEVAYEKVPAKDLNFEMLYKDKLPEDALELQEFVKSIKDSTGPDDGIVEGKKIQGSHRLETIKNLVPNGKRESLYLMVGDVIDIPKEIKEFSDL